MAAAEQGLHSSFRLRMIAIGVALAAGLSAAEAQPSEGRYLFNILKDANYRRTWSSMISQAGPRESWLRADNLSGPSGLSKRVSVDGQVFERADTCMRHDCGDNQFYVLFASGGTRAVGALVQPGRTRFFGKPSPAEQKALLGP
jgi:hypothetical protein